MDHNESLLKWQPRANDNAVDNDDDGVVSDDDVNDNDDGGASNDEEVCMLVAFQSSWEHVLIHTH